MHLDMLLHINERRNIILLFLFFLQLNAKLKNAKSKNKYNKMHHEI